MKNQVTLKNGIVYIMVSGDQTEQSVLAMGSEVRKLLAELKKDGKPLLVLDDITKLGNTDIAARKTVVELAKNLPYRRAAMLGDGSVLMRVGTNLLLRAMGKGDAVRYFEDRTKALQWLTSVVE
ncbi:MAG TPA: STAS/SEC14 domain-containing protein [Candidatus Saccharimonadales bacterium]|nr:STAS/SEC14 domain-containing protein [Candidatus Saccharimonadales bacterium]